MRNNLGLLAVVMASALAACGGEDGAPGAAGENGADGKNGADGAGAGGSSSGTGPSAATPSVSGISPAAVFIGNAATLVISGYGTSWTTAPTVTFDGTGVVVDSVDVASPTALVVQVHAEAGAAAGPRTVTVGSDTFAGFQVATDLSYEFLGDAPKGGSIVLARVTSRNPANPFVGAGAGSLVGQASKDGVALATGDKVIVPAILPDGTNSGLIAIGFDIDAVGTYDLDLASAPQPLTIGGAPRYTGSRALDVAAATPDDAVFPKTYEFPTQNGAIQTRLFRFPLNVTGRYACTAASTAAPNVSVQVQTIGVSGHISDLAQYATGGQIVHGIVQVLQLEGAVPAPRTAIITCTTTPAVVTNEAEPNDETGNTLAVAGQAVHGTLASAADVDRYAFASPGGDYEVRIAKMRSTARLTLRVKDHLGNGLATLKIFGTQSGAASAITIPAGAATLEVFADPYDSPAQTGGAYELSITPTAL